MKCRFSPTAQAVVFAGLLSFYLQHCVASDPFDSPALDIGQVELPMVEENRRDGFVEPRGIHPGLWYLGVFGHYTNTGHLLTDVYENTPADRAGLQVGDRIVTVNGQQVGEVLGRRFPIDTLLQRHASASGRVTLLVQRGFSGSLVNFDVRLVRRNVHF